MSSEDLAAAQKALGLSNAQMARVLQIEDRSYRRLLAGERKILGPIARVVEALRDGWRPADWPLEGASKDWTTWRQT